MNQTIAYVCGEYPRATDTFVQAEVAMMRDLGLDITTISVRRPTSREAGSDEQATERTRTTYLLPCSAWSLMTSHASLLVRHPVRYARAFWMALRVRSPGLRSLVYQMFYLAEAGILARKLLREDIGHIHNHSPDSSGYVTMLAATLTGGSYSLVLHGYGILAEPSRWSLAEKLTGAVFVVCVSHHARSQAMLRTPQARWGQLHVVRCGVDLPPDPLPVRGSASGRLLYVGRLASVKALHVLLRALRSVVDTLPDTTLDIVGDGPERASLEAAVSELGIQRHVRFHGYLPSRDVATYYRRADAFVMSSLFEGVPVVLMEAMSWGVPVVAPSVGGIPELVLDGRTGLLVPPGSESDLADAIRRILKAPDLRVALGREARRHVSEHFERWSQARALRNLLAAHAGPYPAPPVASLAEAVDQRTH